MVYMLKATRSSTGATSSMDEKEWVEVNGVYIEHDVNRSRFLAHIGTGQRPYLTYLVDKSSGTIDLNHTFVPKEMRGRGIAKALCDRAFMYAEKHSFKVIPSCSYVKDTYMTRK